MLIIVLAFGSLVNHPHSDIYNKTLEVTKPEYNITIPDELNIRQDSPFLPAEDLKLPVRLGRVSGMGTPNRRISLILHPDASDELVFFAKSRFSNLNEALSNLREREGIASQNYKSIGYVNLRTGAHRSRLEGVAQRVSEWATRHGFDAVIWTDLPPKGVDFGPNSTGREILALLERDPVLLENTKQYIRDLPAPPNSLQKYILGLDGEAQEASIEDYPSSLTADFQERDAMPQTYVRKEDWFKSMYGRWGPDPITFPPARVPNGVDPVQWKSDRIVEVAKHFQGLPYKRSDGQRGHFPDRRCGLDCSNFVAWVYNYGLGIRFTSDVDDLWNSRTSGRKLSSGEPLKKGDLVFFDGDPKHVVIYIDENHIIDSTSGRQEGVQVSDVRLRGNRSCRPHPENPRYLGARRLIE